MTLVASSSITTRPKETSSNFVLGVVKARVRTNSTVIAPHRRSSGRAPTVVRADRLRAAIEDVMTFCIGIRVRAGLVVLSDTRVVKGSETSRKSKLSTLTDGTSQAVLMTSGLRSVRDKVVARLTDRLESEPGRTRFHELASAYGDELRAVRTEDETALAAGGLTFNSNAILAGRFPGDSTPMLMHVYPEGNWVEATDDAPYFVIGRSSYGKPILDRLLTPDSTLHQAISLAYLAFDATRASATDVDFPIDIGIQRSDEYTFAMGRFTSDELEPVRLAWHDQLREAIDQLPTPWTDLEQQKDQT